MNIRSNDEGAQMQGKQLSAKSFRQLQRLLTTTLICGAVIATPQLANAGTTTLSGAQNTPQIVNTDPDPVVIVDTTNDFSVNTAGGTALQIAGSGSVTYDDATNDSSLVSTNGSGLVIQSLGDNGGTPGSVTVITGGNISGSANGVLATNDGTGGISVTTTGTVNGDTNAGIVVNNANVASTGTVSVFAGTVSGGSSGISALNFGTGSTNVTATGTVTSDTGAGVAVLHSGASLAVNVAAVTGATQGIVVYNTGTGLSTITATDTVTGQNGDGIVVNLTNAANTGGVTINVEDVTGTANGINITNAGTGATNVTATDTIEGSGGDGIFVNNTNAANTGGVTVDVEDVTGSADGIDITNAGTGATSVTAGTVEGTTGNGVYVNNSNVANTGGVTVSVAGVDAGLNGITALNSGTGATSVTATGAVEGTNGYGIGIVHNGTNLTVEATTVTGGTSGILATNAGTGSTTITTTGNVTGNAGSGIAVDHTNTLNANAVTIETAAASGTTYGIYTVNAGTGATNITATGTVTGTANDGILVGNSNVLNSGGVTINAAAVNGGAYGIGVTNAGTGATSVTATGTVDGDSASGLYVNNSNALNAGGVTVSAAAVNGGTNGIEVTNAGTGATSVTATGAVDGDAATGISVNNSNALNTGGVTISAAAVTGNVNGIALTNAGTGNTSVTATGAVEGTTGVGIAIGHAGANLTVDATSVEGGTYGVLVANSGTGLTDITTTGAVTGGANDGINVTNSSALNTGGVTITAAAVTGNVNGIALTNAGTGNTSVTATGAVEGTTNVGIAVAHSGANLTVDATDVEGGTFGLLITNNGTGLTDIETTGTVTGAASDGINAITSGSSTNVSVTSDVVSGQRHGIYTENNGVGTTTINVNDNTTGITGNAVNAVAGATAGSIDVNIATGKVATGGAYGVATSNSGTGTTTIDAGGLVQGGTAGILANSSGSQAIEINVTGEVRNSSTASNALAISSTSGVVTINNNNVITGTVALGNQGNTFNNAQTWNTAGGTSTLGTGVNTFDNQFTGIILATTASGGPANTTVNGVSTFINTGAIMLQNGYVGGFNPVADDVLTLTNGGTGEFQSDNGGLYLDTDVENGTSDRIAVDNVVVTGGATVVFVNNFGPGRATSGDGIEVVDVDGSSANDAFVLAAPVQAGLYDYNLNQGDSDTQSWFLQSSYRDEVVSAGALSVLGSRTALATLSNLNERQRGGEGFSDDQDGRKGIWARAFGQDTKFRSDGGTKAGFNANTWGAQAGLDLLAKDSGDGERTYAGVYIGHATSKGDALNGSSRIGRLEVDATTVGAYFTKYAARGWYVDAAAQYSKLDGIRLRTDENNLRPDGSSYALSLEGGQRFNSDGKINTEVQAQLIYQNTSIDDVTLSDSTRLNIGNVNAVTGRLGVRLAKNPAYAGRLQPWVRANLWHTFNKDANVSSQGATASTPIGGTSGEVQLGLALTPSQASGWSAYVSGGYLFDLSGSEYSGWKGTLGVRKGW